MERYVAIYSDATGEVPAEIINDFREDGVNCLSLVVAGVRFEGMSFDDFELVKPELYTATQLQRFSFRDGFYLWGCELTFDMPLTFFDKQQASDYTTTLHIRLTLTGASEELCFNTTVGGTDLTATGAGYEAFFEHLLLHLQKQVSARYHLKNCFGCQYADYHPVGHGMYAGMMCFKKHKADYLQVTSKDTFWPVIERGMIQVQETYCCADFEMRLGATGYRGGIY